MIQAKHWVLLRIMMKKYKRIYIEITNICNLSCSFCPIEERQKSYMPLEKFEHTLKQVSPLTEQICLHLMGEPLAHPQFEKIMELCDQYQTKIQLTTNGILLKKYESLLLNSTAIHQINISAQSYMDNFPNKPLVSYLDKIYAFIAKAQSQKPDLYLNIRLWNIKEESSEVNEPVFEYLENKLNCTINRNLELGRIKSKKLTGRLYLHFDSRFEWPRLGGEELSKSGRCNGLIDHFAIHANGNVSPCCLDDQNIINLGNLFENSIDEIINSPRAQAMAQGFQNHQLKEELCRKCDYITRFRK
tara:strand:- start:4418 stop:5323 length:906 start_codon:yes stop_codon:yes gene_type:complete